MGARADFEEFSHHARDKTRMQQANELPSRTAPSMTERWVGQGHVPQMAHEQMHTNQVEYGGFEQVHGRGMQQPMQVSQQHPQMRSPILQQMPQQMPMQARPPYNANASASNFPPHRAW